MAFRSTITGVCERLMLAPRLVILPEVAFSSPVAQTRRTTADVMTDMLELCAEIEDLL